MDVSLPIHHRMMLRMHLMLCKYCNRLSKQLMILKKAVHLEKLPFDDVDQQESLSEAARARIKRAVGKVSPSI